MSMKDDINTRLTEAFAPVRLLVIDESHDHAGHIGHRGSADGVGETHFAVEIVSAAFDGKSRVERHRMVNSALAVPLQSGVHALSISAKAPSENA